MYTVVGLNKQKKLKQTAFLLEFNLFLIYIIIKLHFSEQKKHLKFLKVKLNTYY